jgi:hypothetical protein
MNNDMKLIRCGDHKLAPWSIVCVHLLDGSSMDWNAVPQEEEAEMDDYFCNACMEGDDIPLEEMRAICIHCVRNIQKQGGAA